MIEVLHRDDDLVAVAKPPGIFVPPSDLDRTAPALLARVRDEVGRLVHPVHRLDRPTSGVVLFAFTPEGTAALQRALKAPGAVKEYLALARGILPLSGVLCRDLTSASGDRRLFSRTDFVRLAVLAGRSSLLALRPRTGRRHQIRRHLATAAHHLIGDTTYGKGRINEFYRERYGLPRLALHARRIEIDHPRTGERLRVDAPVPADLAEFLARLPGFRPELLRG